MPEKDTTTAPSGASLKPPAGWCRISGLRCAYGITDGAKQVWIDEDGLNFALVGCIPQFAPLEVAEHVLEMVREHSAETQRTRPTGPLSDPSTSRRAAKLGTPADVYAAVFSALIKHGAGENTALARAWAAAQNFAAWLETR